MPLTWNEAVEQFTGPGGPFEVTEAEVRGQRMRVFKNSPPSLRALFDSARARGDAPFLVYEDERWSFADAMARVDALGAALVTRPYTAVLGALPFGAWLLAASYPTSHDQRAPTPLCSSRPPAFESSTLRLNRRSLNRAGPVTIPEISGQPGAFQAGSPT